MFALLWFDPVRFDLGRGLGRLAWRHKTGFDECRGTRKWPYFRTPVQDVKYLLYAGVLWVGRLLLNHSNYGILGIFGKIHKLFAGPCDNAAQAYKIEMRLKQSPIYPTKLVGFSMLKLTKKADYGLMAMKHLAERSPKGSCSAKDVAEAY